MKCAQVLITLEGGKQVIADNSIYTQLEKFYGTAFADYVLDQLANPTVGDPESFSAWYSFYSGGQEDLLPTIGEVRRWIRETQLNKAFSEHSLTIGSNTYPASIGKQVYDGISAILHSYIMLSQDMYVSEYKNIFEMTKSMDFSPEIWEYITAEVIDKLNNKALAYEEMLTKSTLKKAERQNILTILDTINSLKAGITESPAMLQLQWAQYMRNSSIRMELGVDNKVSDEAAKDLISQENSTLEGESVEDENFVPAEEMPVIPHLQVRTLEDESTVKEFPIQFFFDHFPEYLLEEDERGRAYLSHTLGQLGLPELLNGNRYKIKLHNLLSDTPPRLSSMLIKMAKAALAENDGNLAQMVKVLSLNEFAGSDIYAEMESVISAKGVVDFSKGTFENKVRQNSFAAMFVQQFAKTLTQHYTTYYETNARGETKSRSLNAGVSSRAYQFVSELMNHWMQNKEYNAKKELADYRAAKAIKIESGKTPHRQKVLTIQKAKLYSIYHPMFDTLLKSKAKETGLVFYDAYGQDIYEKLQTLIAFMDKMPVNSISRLHDSYNDKYNVKFHVNALASSIAVSSFQDNQEYRYKDPHGNLHYGIQLYGHRTLKTAELNTAADEARNPKQIIPDLYDAYPELFDVDMAHYTKTKNPATLFGRAWAAQKHLHFGFSQNYEETVDKKTPAARVFRELTKLDQIKASIQEIVLDGKVPLMKEGDRPSRVIMDFSTEADYKSRQTTDNWGSRIAPKDLTIEKALPYLRTYLKMEILKSRKLFSEESATLNAMESTGNYKHLGAFADLEKVMNKAKLSKEFADLMSGAIHIDLSTKEATLVIQEEDTTSLEYHLNNQIDLFLTQFADNLVQKEKAYWTQARAIPRAMPATMRMNDKKLAIQNQNLATKTVDQVITTVALTHFMANFEYAHFFLGDVRSFKSPIDLMDRSKMASSTRNISADLGNNAAYVVVASNTFQQSDFRGWLNKVKFSQEQTKKWMEIKDRNTKAAKAGNIVAVTLEDLFYDMSKETPEIYKDTQSAITQTLKALGVKPSMLSEVKKAHTNAKYSDAMAIMSISTWFSVLERNKGLGDPALYTLYQKYSSSGVSSFTAEDLDLIRMTVLKLSIVGNLNTTNNYNASTSQKVSPLYIGKQIIVPNVPGLFENSSLLKEIGDFMTHADVGLVTFKSGVKSANAHTYSLDNLEHDYVANNGLSNVISYNDLGIQVSIHGEEQRTVVTATQPNKNWTMNVYDNGVIDPQFAHLEQDIRRVDRVSEILVNDSMEELMQAVMGLNVSSAAKAIDAILENSEHTLDSLHTVLRESLIKAGVTGDVITALNKLKKKTDFGVREVVFLEELGQMRDIKSLLGTIFEKRVIRQKTKGMRFYQLSPLLVEGSKTVPQPYRKAADGRWLPAQVMVPLPEELWDYVAINYGVKDSKGEYTVTKRALDLFNDDVLRDQENFEKTGEETALTKIRTSYSFRVPHTGPNLSETRQVIQYLIPTVNNMAIVPHFQVSKDGSDFDGDVVTMYQKHFKKKAIKREDGSIEKMELEYIDPADYVDFDNNMLPKEIYSLSGLSTKALEELREENGDTLKRLEKELEEDKEKSVDEYDEDGKFLGNQFTSVIEFLEIEISRLKESIAEIDAELSIKDRQPTVIDLKTYHKALQNFRIEAMSRIHMDEKNIGQTLLPLGIDIFTHPTKGVVTQLLKLNRALEEETFADSFTSANSIRRTDDFNSAGKAIEIGANSVGSYAIFQRKGLDISYGHALEVSKWAENTPLHYMRFTASVLLDEGYIQDQSIPLGSRLTEDGMLKSIIMNEMINYTLANTKEMSQYDALLAGENVAYFYTMVTMGASAKKAVGFINQPGTQIFIETLKDNKGKKVAHEVSLLQAITSFIESIEISPEANDDVDRVLDDSKKPEFKDKPIARMFSVIDRSKKLTADGLYKDYAESLKPGPKSWDYIENQILTIMVAYQVNKLNNELREIKRPIYADRYSRSTLESKKDAKYNLRIANIKMEQKKMHTSGQFYPDYVQTMETARTTFGEAMMQYSLFELPGLANAHKEFMYYLKENFKYNQDALNRTIRAYESQVISFLMSSSVIATGVAGMPASNSFTSRINNLMYRGMQRPTVAQKVASIKTDPKHVLYSNHAIQALVPELAIKNTSFDALRINSGDVKHNQANIKEGMREIAAVDPQLYSELFNLSIVQSGMARNVYNLMPMFDQEAVLTEISKVTHSILEIMKKDDTDSLKRNLISGLSTFPMKFVFNNGARFLGKKVTLSAYPGDIKVRMDKAKRPIFTMNGREYTHPSTYFFKNYDIGLVPLDGFSMTKGLIVSPEQIREGADLKTKCT